MYNVDVEMLHHPIRSTLDIMALGAVVGTAWGHLPEIAAIAGGLWYIIQIVDYILEKLRPNGAKEKDIGERETPAGPQSQS